MELLDLLDKSEQRKLGIIEVLLAAKEPVNLTQLAEMVKSDRNTTREDLAELKHILLEISPDFQLEMIENPVFRASLSCNYTTSLKEIYYCFLKKSAFFQILMHLFTSSSFSVDALADELLISKATFFRKITQLNKILEEFNIKIRNLSLQGSEAQIRNFYYQLFWQGVPVMEMESLQNDFSLDPLVDYLETKLGVHVYKEARLKFQLWVMITKIRMKAIRGKKVTYWDFPVKSPAESPVVQSFSGLLQRYFSRYALGWSHEENDLFYYFVIGNIQTSQLIKHFDDALWGMGYYSPLAYELGNDFLKQVDEVMTINKLTQEKQEELLYLLYQTHYKVIYFPGTIHNHNQKVMTDKWLDVPLLKAVAEKLAKESFKKLTFQAESSYQEIYHQYLILLRQVFKEYPISLKVGYFFDFNQNIGDLLLEKIYHQLQQTVKVELIPYDDQTDLDVVVTNISQEAFKTVKKENIFVFLDFQKDVDYQVLYKFLEEKSREKLIGIFSQRTKALIKEY